MTAVGFVVTVPILIYQFVIGSLIVGAGLLFGRGGAKWAAILASLWTLTHVIFLPLMCLQFVTITCATALAFALAGRPPNRLPPQHPGSDAVPLDGIRRVEAEIRDADPPKAGPD